MSEKPRVKYEDFIKDLPEKKEGTVAWLIERVVKDVAASPDTIRQFGTSAMFTLKRLQREGGKSEGTRIT